MDTAEALDRVLTARPFDHLGAHRTATGVRITVWIPGADRVDLITLKDGRILADMPPLDKRGLFACDLAGRSQAPDYALLISQGQARYRIIDPYQFTGVCQENLYTRPDALYHSLGAQPVSQTLAHTGTQVAGVRFAVYAPSARAVSVIGDFNQWDGRWHPMMSSDDGIWRLFIPELGPGTCYKFELKDQAGTRLPHKQDPYGAWHAQYPSFHSVVWDHGQYSWQDAAWQQAQQAEPERRPLAIYEIQVGSWQHGDDGSPLTYRELASRLIPYVLELGYTHIELMPVSEYPFDGSWGYQPVGLFAPSSRFGSPDDFKYLIDQCHQAGIGVILDWVPAHFPADSHGLARFDGTPLYEYSDPRKGWHPDWNSFIYDYGRKPVVDFLISSAMVWLERFHLDGIRVDAVASMLYLDYSRNDSEWIPNVDGGNRNYEAIAFIRAFNETLHRRFPRAISIAEESTTFPGVSQPTDQGGLGFDFKWNMGWMHDSLEYMRKDPIHRRYHQDDLAFSLTYAFDENFVLPLSHDEVVHGKGTILDRMPGDAWQRMANLRCYYAFMYTHPGKKLSFMGNEFASTREWSHERALDWGLLAEPAHQGCQRLCRDLNHLYRSIPALHEGDNQPNGFAWISRDDADHSVIIFARFDGTHSVPVMVACNFTPVPQDNYRIGLPMPGQWQLVFNSDATRYAGSGYPVPPELSSVDIPWHGQPVSTLVTLPPLATIILQLGN